MEDFISEATIFDEVGATGVINNTMSLPLNQSLLVGTSDVSSDLAQTSRFLTEEANHLSLSSQTELDSKITDNSTNDLLTGKAADEPLIGTSDQTTPNQFQPKSELGIFTVGETGEVNIDFLADGSKYEGELAIFSIEGLPKFNRHGNPSAFIQEAARRATSNSELGHVVISDRTEGARFDEVLGKHEKKNWNKGEYSGIKSFSMLPGDTFGLMLVSHGKIENLIDYPNQTGSKSPLFSLTTPNPNDNFPTMKLTDIGADGQTFAIEDSLRPDYDYNDLIFRIEGATGTAVSIDEMIATDKDWRIDESVQELVKEIVEPVDLAGSTPDEARKSFASTAGKVYRGYLDSSDTDDYYAFSLGMSNTFDILLDGLRSNVDVELLDLEGNIVHSSTNSGTTAESISGTLEAGAYRLRVSSVDRISTAYKLNLSVKPTIEGITTTGSEAPVYLTTAESLPLINVDDFRSGDSFQGSRPEYADIDGSGFSTVILDTGIDLDHPAFGADNNGDGISDRIVFNFDFANDDEQADDGDGHGSNVSSIAASQDPDFPGVAPGADIIHLQVLDANGQWNDVEQALQWVVENAEEFNIASVNMSLGDNDNYQTNQLLLGLDDELAALTARNVIAVAAAGNSFFTFNSQQGVAYPAADPNTIAVGATWDGNNGMNFNWIDGAIDNATDADRIISFSQRHPILTDIFAPGALITAAGLNGGQLPMSGTSQAAPHIAGMAVLAQQLATQEVGRPLTPNEFRQLLIQTGVQINDGDDEDDNVTNTGLNFRRADMLGLADAIMDLRPPERRNIDLVGTELDVVREPLNAGDSFNVNFYLSENDEITYQDYFLGSFRVLTDIDVGNSLNASTRLTLPPVDNPFWLANGDANYFIGMIVDASTEISETDESNNITQQDRVFIDNTRSPDLVGTQFNVVQEPLNAGNFFDVNFTVRNQGFDNAGSFNINFYLSTNRTISQFDRFLGWSFINGIWVNGTIRGGQRLQLPAMNDPFWSTGDGQYYIGMIVDANNVIRESNESNNRNTGLFNDFEDVFIGQTRSRAVIVEVNRVKGDFDPGRRIQGPRRGDSDFYTVLSIDNREWRSPIKGGSNDYEPRDWRLGIITTNPNVPIVIKLYDDDRGPFNDDDHIDIDFRPGDKDLHLTYNWITGQITGDLNGLRGQQIYARGGGDSQVGEIWFTIFDQ